jgi:hypothetical protein
MIHLTGELDTVADNGFVTDVAKVRGAATASSVAAANLKLDGIEEGALAADSVTDIANARASAAVGAIPLATTLVNGLATNTQITKLDGIPSDAQSALQVSAIATNVATGLFSTEAVLAWYLANWSVTDWYLDSVNGNNDNDGITAGTALATAEELSRRLAIALPIAHPVTVHVAQGTYGTLAVSVIQTAVACPFDVVGTTVLTPLGTVTSYTDRVVATKDASLLVVAGVTDWTPYVGRMVQITDGASAGAVCWIAKANPNNGAGVAQGVGTARTIKFGLSPTDDLASPAVTNKVVAAGSAISLVTLPTFGAIKISRVTMPYASGAGVVGRRGCGIRLLDVGKLALDGTGLAIVSECRVREQALQMLSIYDQVYDIHCWLSGGVGETYMSLRSPQIVNCLLGSSTVTTIDLQGVGGAISTSIVQTSKLQVADCALNDVGIFDSAAAGLAVSASSGSKTIPYARNIYGRDNSHGVELTNNSRIDTNSTKVVTGTLGDLKLVTAAAYIPWSALPWVDGERSGEATLVAGTIDVTVPYVLSTQKMQVCAKTFAGTPGFLSVVYVNATTIRITSSSATDTSVVTWHILPVGDNVVIRS